MVEGLLSFGLALYTFDIPTALNIKEIVTARIRARVQARVKEIVAAGGAEPLDAELEAMARQVAAEVIAEISAPIERRTLERPKLGLVLEGIVFSGGGFEARVGVSKGVKVVSLGLSAGVVRAGGNTSALLGLEASLRLTPIGRLRTPVVDLYVRGDVGFDDGEHPVIFVGGGRILLDLL